MSKTRMGKRVASLLLSLVMMLSLLPTTVYATGDTGETKNAIVEETNTSDDNTVGGATGNPELTGEDEGGGTANVSEGETATVATIGSATYETLDEAIAAVADGETIVVNAGEYTLNGSLAYAGKAFTIAAADGADVSFDMSAAVALHGAKITFNNVTFDYKTNGNYIGLQHADTLVYNNCTINGVVFLYAVNETFNSCKFYQDSADAYNVWTYGAQNVAFNGCTFNCVGKAVLVYNEGAVAKTDLTVENTEFNASAPVAGKAAIEIDTSLMAGGATITVDDKTTATGFAAGSKSGSTLWNDKKQTADTNKNTTVTVAGEKVFEPKATVVKPVSVNGTSYETLAEAIGAATPDANGVITYEISGKVNVTATGWIQVAKAGLTDLTAVKFVGKTDDAEICINGGLAILADQNYDIDVSFEALALSKLNPTYGGDYGHSTNYFTTWLRNSGAAENTVTYTNCTFPNGVSNNQYGKTVFDNCKFTNGATGLYNLWNYGGSTEIKNSSFTGTRGIKAYSEGVDGGQIEVADTTFNGLGEKAAIVVSKATTVTLNKVDATECTKGLLQKDIDGGSLKTTIEANGTGISGKFDITAKTTADAAKNEFNISAGTFTSEVSNDYCADGFEVKANDNGTYGVVEAATAAGDGTEAKPYTLEQLGAMTRQAYIEAQNRLNGTMYVTVGDYAYDTNGVLGNGVRDDTTGQIPDHSKLNAYGENGYLGEKNDGANGKSVVFVGGSITSGVTGYTSIDKIGTSLLLALPAYTNVTFKGITFNNVMSFNYQLYTSPWSQLGELKFDGCTFNGIIVGAIAAQTLTFNGCEFKNYTNTTDANSSNPTWIRPAYGNWTQGDNEGQGSDFKSLTTINFTDNKVTSTRPVKFEYISQWDITSTVTATGNSFDISKRDGDTTIKNVGLYLGAHTDANAFNLVAENNTKSANTAALYTIPEGKTSLPLGSTVKNLAGEPVELTDALKWKAGDAETGKIVLKTVEAVASVGTAKYITLAAAIAAAKDGETVTLLKDLDLSATGLTIAANKDVTLDLNGKTLKVANTNSGNIKVVGKLTLQDSTDTAKNGTGTGKVWTETPYISGKQDKVLVAAIDGGTFIMESGLIDAASSIADNANNGQFAVSVQNENADATVIINGGCIKAGWYAIAGNGGDTTYNGNITVNGGILESTADYAIYHPHSGTTTINGGVVFGAAGGVSLNRGKLIVNDGIITSKGTGTTGDWGDGTGNQNAAAINVNAQYGLASVEIKGGKITAEKDAILLTNGKDGTISVSGGTFSSEVPAEYCAEGYTPVKNADGTYGVELGNYVVVGGIKGFENTKFASFADAYDAIKPVLETICANDALGQGTPANADAFDAVFTDVKDGRATLTYTITGNVTYDETGYANLLTMGRRSSHYLTNERHLINFKFVGAEADRGATLTVNSNITLPYEWWGEKITTAISFENLTITGSASNGLYTYQPYFEGIDFKVNNCTLKGIKIYNCANVGGSYTITNSTLDGTGAPAGAYAIHLQGNETAPLNITISGNQISGYDRGINIDQNTAEATISGNTIGINDVNRSCIQLTRLANTEVKDNTLNLNGGNAFTLHKNLAAGSKIDIAGNTIDGNGYLIYDDTKNAIDLTYTNNTITGNVDTTKGVYDGKTHALTDGVDVVINGVKAAQIGDVKYETLQAAIDAANNGETVTLLADATEDVTIDKNITLDLGGKTLTNTGAGKATVTIAKGATATVQNGSIIGGTSYYNIQNNGTAMFTGVTATAGNNDSSMIDNFGTLTIESGAYKGGLNVVKSEEGSTLTINGGKFTGTYAKGWSYNGVILSAGTTIITDGEFIQEATTPARSYPSVILAMQVEGYTSTITITGGKFTNKKSDWNIFYGWGKASSDNFEVSGGTFNKSISDGYCADGFIPTKNADGTYGVKAGKYVAQIGSKKYETLADAIRLAAKGKTITLLDNVTENVEIAANKKLTLDLNGFTLNGGTGTAKAALYNLGTITIQDTSEAKTGTIKRDDAGIEGETSYYVIRNQGTMTIESGNVINNSGYRKTNPTGSMVGSSLICNGDCDEGGTLTIKGGTFTQNNFIAIKNGVLGVLKVTGGTITSNHSAIQNWFEADITGGKITGQLWTDAWEEGKSVGKTTIGGDATFAGEIVMDITGSVAPTLAINGGNLNVTRWRITNAAAKAGAKPAVSGGTFSSAVKEEYCATGYIPTANADGTYGVKAGAYVAKVDNVKYETLQAAINAAKGGSTVRLLADVTLTETAVFPAGKKVDLNLMGHNITATGTALRINGTTDIQSTGGNGTIESTGNVAVAVGNNAKVTVYSGTLKGREGAVITGKSTGATIEIRYNATLIATDNAVIAGNGSQRDGKPNTILVKGSTFIGNIETKGYIACGIYAPWKDNVTVSGGTFNITNGAGIVARAGTVKVTGGTFNCTGTAEGYVGDSKNKVPCAALVFDEAANYPALTESSQILVSGGSFSTDPAVNGATLAAGYVANKDESGMYKVAKANPVAAIGDVKYDTLQAAITAAQDTKDGATITLLTDINTSSYYEVKGENPVTIDLAGHNITGSGISGLFYVTAKGDLTIKGEGTVTAVEDNGAAMAVWVRSPIAKVTLEGGTYTQQITNTADPHFDLIYVERGNVYVEGGTYKGFTPDWTLNCYDEHYQSKEANIEVTGGTFVGFDPANNKAEGENTNFVPAGYVSTKGADGNYTVEEYKPVEVWTGYSGAKVASYATVAEAAEKLDGNKWIVIGKDYTLTEDFTIGGENLDNLYLDVAEGATLTVAEGVTLTVAANAKRLGVRDGATLVNKGTIVVCGSSTSNGFAMLYGTFTGNELTVPEGCFLDNNGKNFFATANENAVYEITFGDGTVKKTADSTNIKGGNVKQIKLLKDVTNGGWTLDSSSVGAEVVLDLNGHTISYNGANRYYATLNVYTKVTIKNGTVKYEGSKRGAIDLVGQGDLTIERDVTIDGGDGFAIFTSGTSKLTVNGKVTANGNYAIAGNGSKDAGGYIDSCDIIVNGGAVISASKGIAIYHPERGTVTINGGTITGHTGIEMCAGQLVVNGGGITSNGDNMDATGSQNAILDGAAISIINRNYPGGVPTAVIKGGTFAANGKDAQTVKAYDYTGDKVAEWTAAGDNVNISGGTFSSIPTNMGVLCADGYKTVYDAYADMYNVVKQDAKITVGKRLSIGNDLTITYLVSLTDCTNPWVKFQFYNDDIKGYTTVEVKNYGTDTVTGPDGKPMDVFTFDFTGINPQRMTDTLKATVYAKDANGNVVEYQVDDYSVAQYCSNKLAKLGQNDPLRKLIGNLVAYGAAAQVYQNYRTDNLVSTVVSGAVSTDYTDRLSSVTQYTEKVLGTAGVNIKGKTLVLSNTFAVRVYFTVNEGVDIANVSFNVTANGKTDTVNSFEKDEKLGYYYFDYANLNATQLDSEVKFESFVNETGVGDMVTYSVNTYLAKKMPNYDKSSNAYKLMAELFNYGCACTEYASK